MTRLMWSVVALLVLTAIGAPCLTFYILIKEYWAEVGILRQELLQCQLGANRAKPASQAPTESQIPPNLLLPLPIPQHLIAPNAEGKLKLGPSNHVGSEGTGKDGPQNPSVKGLTAEAEEGGDVAGDLALSGLSGTLGQGPRVIVAPSRLQNVMISDETRTHSQEEEEEEVCLSKSYVDRIEKSAVNAGLQVDACRRCLTASQRKKGQCGGGSSWKKYRREEKRVRKEMRKEKRRRRRKEKRKLEEGNLDNVRITSTSPFRTSEPQSDIPFFAGRSTGSHNHNMRENHRLSTDFRRGFNQKILRMDEALMQFTETQSAFCKALRDDLGASLEKRGQELGALSEQIAALVRTTTTQVAMTEKMASDQVYAGQTGIEKNLAKLQKQKDDQMRSIREFHKTLFLPAMVTLASVLGEQASTLTNMGVALITKMEMLQDSFLTFATQQGDTLIKLSEEVNLFASKHGNLIVRSRDHAKHLHMNTENFIRELQTRMNNVVKELVLVRLQSQSFVNVNENTYHEISASLNKTGDIVDALSEDLQRRIEKAKDEESDFKEEFKKETDLITTTTETGISQVLVRNHAAMSQIGEVELETRAFTTGAEAAWNEMYVTQEMELRQEADMLANNLRSHNHHTQNILTGLQGTAGTHEQVLEQQRMDFQGFIRKRQDALDARCSSISDWAFLMSSELRRRDEDLHRFLSDELQLSPVSVHGIHEHEDDFLVSRLEDGTLLYDSPSSTSASGSVTFPSPEMELEITTLPSVTDSSLKNPPRLSSASSLPQSSRPHSNTSTLFPPQKALPYRSTLSSTEEGELDTYTIPEGNGQTSVEPPEHTQKSDDFLRTATEDELITTVSHQNDQRVTKTNQTTKGGLDTAVSEKDHKVSRTNPLAKVSRCSGSGSSTNCSSKTSDPKDSKINETSSQEEDRGLTKLQDILQDSSNNLIRFKKGFEVKESFRNLKNKVWTNFSKSEKKVDRKIRKRMRNLFGFYSSWANQKPGRNDQPDQDNHTATRETPVPEE